jgi:hypothetical protein
MLFIRESSSANRMRWPRSRVAPALVPVLSESYTAVDGYVASFKGGKISWGAFNTRRKERAAAAKDEIATILGQSASQ